MKKKSMLLFLLLCLFMLVLTGCNSNSSDDDDDEYESRTSTKKETEEEKIESYIKSRLNDTSIKSINVVKTDDELYNISLSYTNNIVYLHICAEDSQYYAKKILESGNSLNKKIKTLRLICNEKDETKYIIDISDFNDTTVDSLEAHTVLKDAQKNNLNKSIKDAKEDYINEYKNKCETYDYKTIFRYAEEYKGKYVKYTGKVVQVIEGKYANSYRVNVNKDAYGYYDDTIYVTFIDLKGDTPRILEDDIITFYGTLEDLYSYESVMGSIITIPSVTAQYIDIH